MQPSSLLVEYLYFFNAVKSPIKLIGGHGLGKTELIAEYAAYLGFTHHNVRAAHFSDVDVNGYPIAKDNETLTWLPPGWLLDACTKPTVLFLDEINRGKETVRNCFLQLTDSRRINEHVLHPETRIISAENPDNEKYFVNPCDAAELDRWFILFFNPSARHWINWANQKGVHNVIINFIEKFHNYLDPSDEDDPQKKGPSRRSWKRLSDSLLLAEPSTTAQGEALTTGYLGVEVGKIFWQFYKTHKQFGPSNSILEKIQAENLSIQELGSCLAGGKEFWGSILDKGLLRNLLYSASRTKTMEAFTILENSLHAIDDITLYRKILQYPYVRGNKPTTFADDIQHEKSILRMRLG